MSEVLLGTPRCWGCAHQPGSPVPPCRDETFVYPSPCGLFSPHRPLVLIAQSFFGACTAMYPSREVRQWVGAAFSGHESYSGRLREHDPQTRARYRPHGPFEAAARVNINHIVILQLALHTY